jgi:hypothetical protein
VQSLIPAFTDGNTYILKYLANKHIIITTCTSKNYIRLAHNWFLHLKKQNLDGLALICCLDEESYLYTLKYKLPSVYLDQELSIKKFKPMAFGNAYKVKHHVCRVAFLIPHLIYTYNVDVIYTDTDMIVLRDPTKKLYEETNDSYDTCIYTNKTYEDILMGKDDYNKGGIPLLWTKNFIEKFYKGCEGLPNFNLDTNTVISYDILLKNLGIKTKPLNPFQFTNKTIWDRENLKYIIKNNCYMLHYNIVGDITKFLNTDFARGVAIKEYVMKKDGNWLIENGG